MHSEPLEPSRQFLPNTAAPASGGRRSPKATPAMPETAAPRGALVPHAVDAALADEATAFVSQRGSRRDLIAAQAAAKSMHKIDVPHVKSAASEIGSPNKGGLLQSLAEQLNMLQVQQEQIRRLLEQAERHSPDRHVSRA